MGKCFSLTASMNCCFRYYFRKSGLRSVMTDLGDGTIMHCWIPKTHNPKKPTLLILHGFGANGMWLGAGLLRTFINSFNIYVPDLLFFGDSFTTRPERTESFQAQCVMKLMEAHGVLKLSLFGFCYGGMVGYSMAAQFPDAVERVVLCCAGVCLEEKDLEEGLFVVSSVDEATSIFVAQTPEKLRQLARLSSSKPPKIMPSCFLRDFIDVMLTEYVEEKKQLIYAFIQDRKLSDVPKITQPTLIVWGAKDQMFPLELGYRLQSHIGENAQLEVLKNAGHDAVDREKPKEFSKHLKTFLVDSLPPPPQLNGNKVD